MSAVQAAGVVVLCPAAPLLWLLLRPAGRSDWGFPKGHCEADESLENTARRETHEETGLRIEALAEDFRYRMDYTLPSGAAKEVTFFLAEVPSSDGVRLSAEHEAFAWVQTPILKSLLPYPSQHQLVDAVLRYAADKGWQ